MNLLLGLLLLPIWACGSSARPELHASQFSAAMEAQSPGLPSVRVVHHQDMNKKILIALIVASSLLGGILLLLSCLWIFRIRNLKNSNTKNRESSDMTKGISLSPMMSGFSSTRIAGKKNWVTIIDYETLEAATNNFHECNILGEGGHEHLYKACFNEKLLAIVKRLDVSGREAEKAFENEVNWLSKVKHQNIISLLGYCIHGETRFLVYEMMQNGSLEAQLHGSGNGSALTWNIRMKIAVDVARGLEYLHEHCNPPVIHRDIRSSNILLDANFNVKLSDFGLAVTLGSQNTNIKLSGTLGHVAPEYLLDGKLTDKSDVYAFGIVLLELLIGRRPVEKMSPAEFQSIVTWAMPQLTDRSKLPNIVDPAIRNTMDLKHLYQVAAVAVLCVQPEPSYRPLITDVLHSLIPMLPTELGGSLRITDSAPASQ